MKDNGFKIAERGKGKFHMLMEIDLQEIGKITNLMVKGLIIAELN